MEETCRKIDRDLQQNIKIIKQSAMRQMGQQLIGYSADLPLEVNDEIVIDQEGVHARKTSHRFHLKTFQK